MGGLQAVTKVHLKCTLCTMCTVQCLRDRGSVEFTAMCYWVTGVGSTPSVLTSAVSLAERVIGGRLFYNINALHYLFCTVQEQCSVQCTSLHVQRSVIEGYRPGVISPCSAILVGVFHCSSILRGL